MIIAPNPLRLYRGVVGVVRVLGCVVIVHGHPNTIRSPSHLMRVTRRGPAGRSARIMTSAVTINRHLVHSEWQWRGLSACPAKHE